MNKHFGFNLIELLIVIGIIGILTTIAYPLYSEHVTKVRRNLAECALVDIAGRLEQYYALNNSYAGATLEKLKPNAVAFYKFNLSVTKDAFLVRAEPTGSQAEKDSSCGVLSLNQVGEKNISGSEGILGCWN